MKKFFTILIVLFVVVSSVGLYYYYENMVIPKRVEEARNELMDEIGNEYVQRVSLWRVKENSSIPKHTIIDESIMEQNLEYVEEPLLTVPDGYIVDPSEFLGKRTLETISGKEEITSFSISEDDFMYQDFNRIETYETDDDIGGILSAGQIVDIMVNYRNGDYDVVLPKVQILDVVSNIDVTGLLKPGEDHKYEIMVSVENEEDTRDMTLAVLTGELTLRAYHDESQRASLKTFDYEVQISRYLSPEKIATTKVDIDVDEEVSENQVIETKVEE